MFRRSPAILAIGRFRPATTKVPWAAKAPDTPGRLPWNAPPSAFETVDRQRLAFGGVDDDLAATTREIFLPARWVVLEEGVRHDSNAVANMTFMVERQRDPGNGICGSSKYSR
jgi:hypothetical protein